jgi:hypothetical protein
MSFSLPVDFLLSCSKRSLADFELAALDRAASLRRGLKAAHAEMVRAEAEALVARWLLDRRGEILELARMHALQKSLDFVDGLRADTLPALQPAQRFPRKVTDQ